MTEKRHIPGFVYKLMLLAATIIWGFAFVVMKDAVGVLPPAQLIGVRFFLDGLAPWPPCSTARWPAR